MKLQLFFLLFFLMPFVSGHAAPIGVFPLPGQIFNGTPSEMYINFSERIETSASNIVVTDPDGNIISGEAQISHDRKALIVYLENSQSQGAYSAKWHVISADDGHFTKGVLLFAVGDTQNIELSTLKNSSSFLEASGLWIEMLGQAIILGVLMLLFFKASKDLRKIAIIGFILVIVGSLSYIMIKSILLYQTLGGDFAQTLLILIKTRAGIAAFLRFVVSLAMLSWIYNYKKLRKDVLAIAMVVLGVLFVIVSHSAAGDYKIISVAMTLIHVLSKEAWIGLLIVLALANIRLESKTLNKIVSILLLLTAITGAYIVWLDMKAVENIHTLWGERLILLTIIIIPMVAMRFLDRDTIYSEAILGAMILFITSLLVITTPPLQYGSDMQIVESQDARVLFYPDYSDFGSYILEFYSQDSLEISSVGILATSGNSYAKIPARQVSDYKFSFYKQTLPHGWDIEVVAQRPGGYDINAEFKHPSELIFRDKTIIEIGLLVIILSLIASCLLWMDKTVDMDFWKASVILLVYLIIAGIFIMTPGSFEKACRENDHEWKIDLPMVDGMITSPQGSRGCSLKAEKSHFIDEQRYVYYMKNS